ncbi:hypothetical protein C1924_03090 [Stenotrophomonas sp. ESTM1D_MKCIP4_1]|uniref:hypothetical protein n=1 Tax=Stenotrophomonas sp. ESTM1D_MKCIP4_1 TaxID=2072414 RepID=UPI000D53FFD0|nr:hypothetical protein [Stenotrophomonas sp. ESTM1D_MKCIP4_1]AWH52246.1 hypothetical protein C1924_03090 [Stenotrophomonas sp. ESTM1D_MKCIP4_1]
MDERLHKRLLLAQALLFGLPGVLLGGAVALAAVHVGLAKETRLLNQILLVGWGTAGVLGIVAWLRLGSDVLLRGRAGLHMAGWVWWILLLLGALAAMPAVVLGVVVGLTERAEGFALLLFGPPLLLPAAHLAWLRWRYPVAQAA